MNGPFFLCTSADLEPASVYAPDCVCPPGEDCCSCKGDKALCDHNLILDQNTGDDQ